MERCSSLVLASAAVLIATATAAAAQTPTTPYGAPISLDQTKKVLAGAEAEAHKNSWNVVIAILDSGGHLVLLQRLDNTQFASVEVAQQKAYSAVAFRLPTKVFQDGVAAGGAIGISGVTSQQDNQIAKAGAGALK
ncbi:MAG: heme-binding protein [Acidobacteria bacterium]|nr:heme-binding protein [Acidobacteriota bacterium]